VNPFFTIIAGPCAIESKKQMMQTAKFLSEHGIRYMRGGAYKPRSSPYSFQGLKERGIGICMDVQEHYGFKICTELISENDYVDDFCFMDVIQIGARNSMNYPLLSFVGSNCQKKTILLKRFPSGTLNDLLMSAEYIKKEGHENIILCERGVPRIGNELRNTLDIGGIAWLKQNSKYKVIGDPSHSTGRRSMIIPVSRAIKAVGADGLIVEVHPNPKNALCDSEQQLDFREFVKLLNELEKIN